MTDFHDDAVEGVSNIGGFHNEEAPSVQDNTEYYPQNIMEVKKAEYDGHQKYVQQQRDLLFWPSFKSSTFSNLPEKMRRCYQEDKGLYVEEYPPVSKTNVNLLKMRILKTEEGHKWFRGDSSFITQANPLNKIHTRPPFFRKEDLHPTLQTNFRKAMRTKCANTYFGGAVDPEYQLDVDIGGIIFSNHPLFSREHLLGVCLAQLCDQYHTRQRKNLTVHLTDKLNGLRALKKMLYARCGQSFTPVMQQRITEISEEIRKIRQQRDSEQEEDKVLMKKIVKMWKELKAQRMCQYFTNTPYNLQFRKVTVDGVIAKQEYEEEIMAEVAELEEESKEDYENKLVEYKTLLDEWKIWHHSQRASSRKEKKAQVQDVQSPVEEGPSKPKPPMKPNMEIIQRQVREKASRIRRKPCKSILIPELSMSGKISASELCSRDEFARREEVKRRPVFIKIWCNDKVVCRTDSRTLSADFTVHFGQSCNLMVINCPRSIKLQVFEEIGSSCSLLAELNVPIPESAITWSDPLEEFEFGSNQKVAFNYDADINNQILLTSGKVSCSISWGTGENDEPLAPPVYQQAGGLGHFDDEYLHQQQEFFHFEMDEFNFVTDEEMETSKRLNLLELRNQGFTKFSKYKCVPALENEVTDEMLQEYETSLKEGDVSKTKPQYLLADLVMEKNTPSPGILGQNFGKLAGPKLLRTPEKKGSKKGTTCKPPSWC